MTPHPSPSTAPDFVAVLDHVAAIGFDGADAATFLHGQLSTDVIAMPVGAVALTTYNSPKGRVLATLVLLRRDTDSFVAIVAADLAAALRKRLAMFVLRAKVTVRDSGADAVLLGVGGDGAAAALAATLGTRLVPGRGAVTPDGDVLGLPDGRTLVIARATTGADLRSRLALPAAPAAAFDLLGIRAGVPWVTLATQDRFVLQALNGDLLDAVNFRKGCYPGQEIVARMQYLGRLKERLFAFATAAAPPAAGTPLYSDDVPEPAQGTVVNAAAVGDGSEFLAVVHYAAAMAGTLRLGAPDGAAVVRRDLPYAIPAPVAPPRVKL